jgi:hypothetical protein
LGPVSFAGKDPFSNNPLSWSLWKEREREVKKNDMNLNKAVHLF